jgi:hypothetical protein
VTVWVVFSDHGHDGYSEPHGVFSSLEKARAWMASDNARHYTKLDVEEYDVDFFVP